jgi:hypothetical protein
MVGFSRKMLGEAQPTKHGIKTPNELEPESWHMRASLGKAAWCLYSLHDGCYAVALAINLATTEVDLDCLLV